jgi:hypothetical protein
MRPSHGRTSIAGIIGESMQITKMPSSLQRDNLIKPREEIRGLKTTWQGSGCGCVPGWYLVVLRLVAAGLRTLLKGQVIIVFCLCKCIHQCLSSRCPSTGRTRPIVWATARQSNSQASKVSRGHTPFFCTQCAYGEQNRAKS